ncbi:mannitol-1-phosphate 5-dehydrogenase [Virgibacillus sp. SK37]|uniref:mannitol-1-phosphate 5-dehydrogenase n=1 Tax=Virgibacillus sp. SK37 TaxID=403957 RepID=UPI0004D19FD9|nr:mannitol-1-phosphate 5-dehydrogenase [Virgibacillus sp. SK37]AIF44589.1 mannitol-1-phosphate 5-dehydrogenase [Virgibacillus sp. SK37]
MLAVHFGAGNIGRGFVGALLSQSGYHTLFVDVNETMIQELNQRDSYYVTLASETGETLTVRNISGVNSVTDSEKVVEAIATADIVTTAIGPNILPKIAGLIAKGIQQRLKTDGSPLNIIACENMIGGSSLLKEHVYTYLTEEEKQFCEENIGFPNAAVDRIVPNQKNEDILAVSVEPYFEWVVEKPAIKGAIPEFEGITYVEDLQPFIERKLFTVNTGHAAVAYVGKFLGYSTISDAMKDEKVQEIIHHALQESGEALVKTYLFDQEEHNRYIKKIIDRFKNPYISDEVTRVGRGPIRKLGPQDRLVRPALMYIDTVKQEPVYLATVIAAALNYTNDEDEEAVKLQTMIGELGYGGTLQAVSELEMSHPLIPLVIKEWNKLKKLV